VFHIKSNLLCRCVVSVLFANLEAQPIWLLNLLSNCDSWFCTYCSFCFSWLISVSHCANRCQLTVS